MPALLAVEGCRGLSLLVDRSTGRCIATTSWDDEQLMRLSEDQVRPLRDRVRRHVRRGPDGHRVGGRGHAPSHIARPTRLRPGVVAAG